MDVPEHITFSKLKQRIETGEVLTNSNNEMIDFTQVGDFRLTVDGQSGVDGWVNLHGRIQSDNHETQPTLVVWLSQSKYQDISLETGEASGSLLYKNQIAKEILKKMVDVYKFLKTKDSAFAQAVVVYDVFSNRMDAIRKEKPIQLPQNSGMFITRNDCLDQVLGGFVARRRDIEN